jgi:hypothetical protein
MKFTFADGAFFPLMLIYVNIAFFPLMVYNVVVRKLTYEETDLKGEMVNIYQKPQALINYLIDKFSNEGDWVLDLFSGSGKNYDLIFMKSYFNLRLFLIYIFTVSNFIIYFVFGD